MTTGEPPFRGSSKASLIVAILSEEPAPPVTRQPLTRTLFDRTIRRCLAKQPDERWQTAADLAAELKYILETPQEARPLAVEVLHPGRALWGFALGLALVGLTIRVIWQTHSTESALIVSSQRPVGTFEASYRQATISSKSR